MRNPTNSLPFLLLAFALTTACGGGGSDAPSPTPSGATARIAVVGDTTRTRLAGFLRGRGLAVDNFPSSHAGSPDIDGDYIVWEDDRNGTMDIYAYRISAGEEFPVSSAPGDQRYPSISGDIIVWLNHLNGTFGIQAYRLSTGQTFTIVEDSVVPWSRPQIDGDIVVWKDIRNGNGDIYAYRFSSGTEIEVVTTPESQDSPMIHGDIIAWRDFRNGPTPDLYGLRISTGDIFPITTQPGNEHLAGIGDTHIVWEANGDIFAYRLDTGETIPVVTHPARQYQAAVSGDVVAWIDTRNNEQQVYAFRLSTGREFQVSTVDSLKFFPMVSNGHIAWRDWRHTSLPSLYAYDLAGQREYSLVQDPSLLEMKSLDDRYILWTSDVHGPSDIYFTGLQQPAPRQRASLGNRFPDLVALDQYDAILFGDNLSQNQAIRGFTMAERAGINMLAIGTYDNDMPLGSALASNGDFGLTSRDDYGCADMTIVTTPDGDRHAIFEGFDTTIPLRLEKDGVEQDEQIFTVDPTDPEAPTDWTVLANLGMDMCQSGQPAIVEFTTSNGTRVMLDGSANTYDGYEYWTPDRWQLLYNQVLYLSN